jgi:SAM-dependent methyltransferase
VPRPSRHGCLERFRSVNVIALDRFSTVTEQPGQRATHLQLTMIATRYAWARRFCVNRNVLEVACGSGIGLGVLSEVARTVQAGDIDPGNLDAARHTYAGDPKVRLQRLDAMELPYRSQSLDVVLLFEAVYYLPGAPRFFEEAHRVLRAGGRLLVVTVNPDWHGFNPSPLHTRYLPARDLQSELRAAGFEVELSIGFPEHGTRASRAIAAIRRAAIALHLVPGAMSAKTPLKRLFYGRLKPIPPRLDLRQTSAELPQPWRPHADLTKYRVLYAAARKEFPAEPVEENPE